jgi:hypothetical protein
MEYSNTTMGGSSPYKPIMETRVDKCYCKIASKTYDTYTHANYSSFLDASIHIRLSTTTTTCTTHS